MQHAHSRLWIGATLVAAAALLVGGLAVARAGPASGGTLVIGLDQEPPTLDPHASPSAVTFQVIASVTENLLFHGRDGKLVPWLAESWTVSPDGKTYTFKLRKDVKFHDGTPFNAAAVKFNFDRIMDPNFKAGGSRGALAGYEASKVVDEHTVQVTFKAANSPFLTYAAGGTLSFVSPKAVREMGDEVHKKAIGSGPFMVKDYVAKSHTTIVRNPAYNRKAPWSDRAGPAYLDAITWKFIPEAGTRVTTVESGETQGIYLVPSQALPRLEGSANFRVERMPWPGVPLIWVINVTRPPLDEVKVRQAINFAIDREAFVATIFKGTARKAQAPLNSVMLDDPSLRQYYPYNLNKARELLNEAGWRPGPDGIRLKGGQRLEVLLNLIEYGGGSHPFTQAAHLMQAALREAGIDMKIKAQARPPFYEDNYKCTTHGPIMFLRSTDLDGLYFLFHSSLVGGNFNWSCYKNPRMDQMLEQGRREPDPAKRRALYLQIMKVLMDEAVSVPLVEELAVWAYRANVQGTKYNFSTYPVLN
ncbi:MAG: ABC transporter substrate-binding protein, partial [Armatimonadetes bacterium]|nr:ABC transporter substrate-binding protein [Armatimonadota bacterium]